jgi:hypothetical protein
MILDSPQETLAEIPTQLLQYFRMKNIQPRAPLQRMATDMLIGARNSSVSSSSMSVDSAGGSVSGPGAFRFNPSEV